MLHVDIFNVLGGTLYSKTKLDSAARDLFSNPIAGSTNTLPLHEAGSHLLEGFLPYLADEAAFFADILLMYRGDEDQLRLGPTPPPAAQELRHSSSKHLAAAADAVGGVRVQQQQRGASVMVEVLRPPGCALTAAGVRAVETM